jgi:hypothetical protein
MRVRVGEWLAIGDGAGLSIGATSAPFRLVVGDRIGPEDCPYLRRWFVQTPVGTARIHLFMRSDDDRALHDHPWSFTTLVLRGGYVDVTECPPCEGNGRVGGAGTWPDCGACGGSGERRERLRPGMMRHRPALHRHRVECIPGQTSLTLVVSGPKVRTWGFWPGGRFVPWRKFIDLNGTPACADEDLVAR